MTSIKYQPELDGLRAFSILFVIIYHFFPSLMPSGFIGVDIFFVISGYLMTNIILRELKNGDFLVSTFYMRRARRLLPALFFVLICSISFGFLLFFSDELLSLGIHSAFAMAFSLNFRLITEGNYFDQAVIYKPLAHLWSLAIEEQFYLIWPFFLMILTKLRFSVMRFIFLVVIISFFANMFKIDFNQTEVFYSLSTRLWELALGGLAWTILDSNKNFVLDRFADFLSTGGLLFLFSGIFIIKDNFEYPGWHALFPTLGTFLILLSIRTSFLCRILSKKYFVWLGLISYPLYLWHWPILSFANIIFFQNINLHKLFFILFVSFLLAALTYRFIESPIRKKTLTKNLALSLFSLGICIFLIGLFIFLNNGFPKRYPAIETIRSSNKNFIASTKQPACLKTKLDLDACDISKPEEEASVAVVGDSHANHFYPGLKKYYDSKGENLLLLARMSTPPLYGIQTSKTTRSLDKILNFVANEKTIHTIILSAAWATYYEQNSILILKKELKTTLFNPSDPNEQNQNKNFIIGLQNTVSFLKKFGKKVIILFDAPYIYLDINQCLPRPFMNSNFTCSITKIEAEQNLTSYKEVIVKLAKNLNFSFFDPLKDFCNQEICPLIQENQILFTDSHHLSLTGSEWILRNYKEN